ncbi:hypothetical protein JW756_07080 [Candidatus Woesearchaeota archaeon]|nr:hypothetical protein [Candidatus Woesearchaeota archaeon]
MNKQNELTPEEEKILRSIELEKLCDLMIKKQDQLVLHQAMIKLEGDKFFDRFQYTYPEKITKIYDIIAEQGVGHVIYHEPHFILLSAMVVKTEDAFPMPKNRLDFHTLPYHYRSSEAIRELLDFWYYNLDLRKTLVLSEDHLFNVDKLRDGPDHKPHTPFEEAALFLGGYTNISLTPFCTQELSGSIMSIDDKMKFYKKIGNIN